MVRNCFKIKQKRQLLATVVNSQQLYAVLVWADELKYNQNVSTILRLQRTIGLRVLMPHRMDSIYAIIEATIPAYLLAKKNEDLCKKIRIRKEIKR